MRRAGFTLIELMVVISIILLVSVLALPSIVTGLGERTLLASVQALQGALVSARDGAVQSGSPQGIRLMPSATDPTLLDRVVPLIVPPDYKNGLVSIYPAKVPYAAVVTGGLPCLVLEESPAHWVASGTGWLFIPNEPTSWYHNIRLGDRISINGSKPYVVCGPRATISDDLTVNADPALLAQTYTAPDGVTTANASPEYLLLVNGIDDNGDGFTDNGWDGVDNDLLNGVDDMGEWEAETWVSSPGVNLPYVLTRRPVPGKPQSIVPLQVPVSLAASVVDPTATPPVPTLYLSPLTGSVDLMVAPDGTIDTSGPYAAPSSVSLARVISRFVLSDPLGHQRSLTVWHRTGLMEADVTIQGHPASLP